MKYDKCPWCNAVVQTDPIYGRGYIARFDLPRIEWECGSGRLNDEAEPSQSGRCGKRIFKEVLGLRGEVQTITKQRDDLLWLLHDDFITQHPMEPNWLVHARQSREAADTKGGE